MSYDLLLWRFKPDSKTSPRIVALRLEHEVPCHEIARLDYDRLRREVDVAFPDWDREEGADWGFDCTFEPEYLVLSLHKSTPKRVLRWFLAFAKCANLYVFDPQSEQPTAAEKEEVGAERRRLVAERAAADAGSRVLQLLKQAEAGDTQAQVEPGNMYAFGEHVGRSPAEAAKWYTKAGLLGNHNGMFNLADCYRKGEGVTRDVQATIRWLEKATQTDKVFAAFELGEIYAKGEGLVEDLSLARHYCEIALANGHAGARKAIRLLDSRMENL